MSEQHDKPTADAEEAAGASRPAEEAPPAEAPDASGDPQPQAEAGATGEGADAAEAEADEAARAHDADADAPKEPPAEEEPDYKDLYLRAAAEVENIRKRARRDVQLAGDRGVARLARELLPSLDNLERALAASEAAEVEAVKHLADGVRMVQQELLAAFERVGIERYSPEGETFDPRLHEAVAQRPVDGAASGTIVEVYETGYRYKDEILRAAKVVVAQ